MCIFLNAESFRHAQILDCPSSPTFWPILYWLCSQANSWAESNSGKGKPQAEIRRRSSHSYGDWSPLLFAAREGIPDLCRILIRRKADINQKDQDKLNPGYTALITAATRGDLEMVELLVNQDADVTAGDRNGKTALMLAEQRGFSSVAEFLQSKMATENPEASEKQESDKKAGECVACEPS